MHGSQQPSNTSKPGLVILLLSTPDGRETLVDLTRTLAEMAQHGKIRPQDITAELVDAELCEVTMRPSSSSSSSSSSSTSLQNGNGKVNPLVYLKPEPDLVLTFGDFLVLDGFPPWQIRLSEIFCARGVEYMSFLRGLYHYAGAQMRFGR